MTQVVILAAGQGKRMHSSLPKVLHPIGGKSIIEHVITTAKTITQHKPIIIFGHQGKVLQDSLSHMSVQWVEQSQQLGTAHAVLQSLPILKNDEHVLILCGDVPLISADTLRRLIDSTAKNTIGMLTAQIANPHGYGRIIRHENRVIKIVEEKDATDEERLIKEINPGIYFIPSNFLKETLPTIKNTNAQKEFYLTDIIANAVNLGLPIHTVQPKEVEEVLGINDRAQLASLERFYQTKQAEKLMQQGVTIVDPARIDIRGELIVGRDVFIDVNVIFEGRVVIGDGCVIGANTIVRNSNLATHTEIKPFSLLDGVEMGAHCVIGPFARLRPGTYLDADVHIGNFVEVKNSSFGQGSKANHLSYIGDSEVGKSVNIGAGTITCNYDGANKHKTIIGDYVHIGSDTQLVAPVTVGDGATIAAGATITKDVPANQLTLTHRLEQRVLPGWKRPEKK